MLSTTKSRSLETVEACTFRKSLPPKSMYPSIILAATYILMNNTQHYTILRVISIKWTQHKLLFKPSRDQNFYSRSPQDVGRVLATEVPLKENEKL